MTQGQVREDVAVETKARFGVLQARRLRLHSWIIAYGGTLLLLIACGVVSPSFVSPGNILAQLAIGSFLGLAATGQMLVILTGGIDLSLPWTLNVVAILVTNLTLGSDRRLIWALPLALAIALIVGLVNGLGVAYLRVHPVVMTLGMNFVLQGASLVYTNGSPQGVTPKSVLFLGGGKIAGFPVAILLFALVAVGATLLLQRSGLGRAIYAVGNNAWGAYLAGINTRRTLVWAYVLAALCSGLAGLAFVGYAGQSYLGMGDAFLFPAITAVVLGGTDILGGAGSYAGTIGGVLFVTFLQALMTIIAVPQAGKNIIYGLLVLVLTFAYRLRRSRIGE